MPIGIIGSLLVCTVLYILVSGVMVGLVPYQQLDVAAPMAAAMDAASARGGRHVVVGGLMGLMPLVVKLGAIAGLSSTVIVQMMAQPRIFMAMGEDGLLPKWGVRGASALPYAARHDHHHGHPSWRWRRGSRRSACWASW